MLLWVGNFSIDLTFNTVFCLSGVRSGRAALIHHMEIQNTRGHADWLVMKVIAGNWESREKSLRNISFADPAAVSERINAALSAFVLPASFLFGDYDCTLVIMYSGGEKRIPFHITVMDPRYMCSDLNKADELAAYVTVDDETVREAVQRIADKSPEGLYNRLLSLNHSYLAVPGGVHPNIQIMNPARETLKKGGSCAEISVLYASMLGACNLNPVLIEFRDHMAAGCIMRPGEDWAVIRDHNRVLEMCESGELLLTDPVSTCIDYAQTWEKACENVVARVKAKEPFALVNVMGILRRGEIRGVFNGFFSGICPSCGYHTDNTNGEDFSCPACNFRMSKVVRKQQEYSYDPAQCKYATSGNAALLTRVARDAAGVNVPGFFNGLPVTKVCERAFEDCSAQIVRLPDRICEIGPFAFAQCRSLKTVLMRNSVTVIGRCAFMGCSALERIMIPGSVVKIPQHMFHGCSQLKEITISEGVEEICDYAFEGCASLERICLPASVKKVSRNAFSGCPALVSTQYQSESNAFR